jgi:hypothetical protein
MSKRKSNALMMRVVRGGIEPADEYTRLKLRERGYKVGDLVSAEIRKLRNPGFHRLAHNIGTVCANNIDEFHGIDAHTVLKKLQASGKIACDEDVFEIPGFGYFTKITPQSLSFESMEEGEFQIVVRQFCNHIAERYWPSMTPEAIEEMAGSFVDET